MPNLVGIGLSQVPTNSMLGGLAYQSPDHASIKDLDLKNLSQINSEIADTAVDIFVYDTSKDSDGGAWRKRTTHTSWYNETLGTATRGTRREFPAVAVIVSETGSIIIYDGDDPDLPMWMVFNGTVNPVNASGTMLMGNNQQSSVKMLNGVLVYGTSGQGAGRIKFICDDGYLYWSTSVGGKFKGNISQRNSGQGYDTSYASALASNSTTIGDVAMTVLPNAPIDSATGLPVPTIAVATDSGVSVIKDDGTVVDYTHTNSTYDVTSFVEFLSDTRVAYAWDDNITPRRLYITPITSADSANADLSSYPIEATGTVGYGNNTDNKSTGNYNGNLLGSDQSVVASMSDRHIAVGDGSDGLNLINVQTETGIHNSLVAFATTSYNTGWMHGNIKGAFLSDTDATNVTVGSAHYTETFTGSGDNSWNLAGSATISGGVLTLANAADSRATDLTAASSLTTGQKYIAEIEIASNTSGVFNLDDDGNGAGQGSVTVYGSCASGQTGTFLIAFTKTGSSRMRLIRTSGGPITITDFKIYTAEEQDRSVNNNGLKVFGTVTKSAVATGAELVAYSGWSASNYLIQPYNSALDFGTGDWCYMFWYNPNDAASGNVLFSRWSYNVNTSTAGRIGVYFNSGNLRFDTTDDAGSSYQGHVGSDGTQDSNTWHCGVILRRGNNAEIWVDGVRYVNNTLNSTSDGSYTNTSAILEIGNSPNMGSTDSGIQLALLRASASAPSPEQIKKIYEDEKVLFQENAACTLYGSSDAVTALAYDEVTDRLHVGTSSGRSDFQGLRRINNTTTAVTTAISAHDEFIVEQ